MKSLRWNAERLGRLLAVAERELADVRRELTELRNAAIVVQAERDALWRVVRADGALIDLIGQRRDANDRLPAGGCAATSGADGHGGCAATSISGASDV